MGTAAARFDGTHVARSDEVRYCVNRVFGMETLITLSTGQDLVTVGNRLPLRDALP